MIDLHERYIVDENGNRTAVVPDIIEYRQLIDDVEELEAIKAYDAAKASSEEEIPFELAVVEIETAR